jgi:hypothetical protein
MGNSYLDAGQQGNNRGWHYLLGIAMSLFFWLGAGTIATVGFIVGWSILYPSSAIATPEQIQIFLQTPSIPAYVASNIPSVFFLLGIVLTLRFVHQRRFTTLVSLEGTVLPKRILLSFAVWFGLLAVPSIVDYWLHPQNFIAIPTLSEWWIFLPLALILTPLQTSAEEFFFRAYVLQGLGLITRHPFLLIVLSSLLFAIPHFGNPEMQRSTLWLALSYWAIGAFLTLITLKDQRLELALGVHAANNLFVALFVNTKDSALPAPSLFILKEVGDPRLSFSLFLLLAALYYFLFFGKRSSPTLSRQ